MPDLSAETLEHLREHSDMPVPVSSSVEHCFAHNTAHGVSAYAATHVFSLPTAILNSYTSASASASASTAETPFPLEQTITVHVAALFGGPPSGGAAAAAAAAAATTDSMPAEPYGCMARYFDYGPSTMSEKDSAFRSTIHETKVKCTTPKIIEILDDHIKRFDAMHRLTEFGIRFDSFKGQKVHTGPCLRMCDCNDGDLVIHAGCEECCITWPEEVPKCKCDERFMCNAEFCDAAAEGCMHPGRFDQLTLDAFWDEHSMCLICLHETNSNGVECKHQPLYADLCLLEGTGAWQSSDDHSKALESLLSRDTVLQIKLDERKRKADVISV
ncbi:hypothetical protein T484DRAFT_1865110 [Baffinella frigidus]|nr:hypothetical protein T484DRAFT_1865110 [Cryptophyta sp. CCMP2293]